MFRYLTDMGNHIDMFTYKVKTKGRASKYYEQLDLSNAENLLEAIKRTLIKS